MWCEPHKHLASRFTTLPPQSDPSRAGVPQALEPQILAPQAMAVGFQDVGTSNRLQ